MSPSAAPLRPTRQASSRSSIITIEGSGPPVPTAATPEEAAAFEEEDDDDDEARARTTFGDFFLGTGFGQVEMTWRIRIWCLNH